MLIKALAAAAGNLGGGYTIDNSLRFNDNDSAYLSRTPASAGNRRTWTWSGWVKRGNVGINGYLFGADTAAGSGDGFGFISSDQLKVYVNGAVTGDLVTNALFRDVGGWYHLVVSADSTQATASNRIKVYVNGEQVTSFATETYPPQNFDFDINGVFAHWLGRVYVYYFDGYMAEINFVDGQALTPDDFGEINEDTGEWSPKAYEGTYGTNGFYLPFNGNANDSSGNGNNWTENNLASTDYMIDTPTNNFAVLNPLAKGTSTTLFEGNLRFTSSQTYAGVLGSVGVTSGKWYWEGLTTTSASAATFGIGNQNTNINTYLGIGIDFGYLPNGTIYGPNDTTTQSGLATYTTGDIIGITMDMDAGEVKFYKNNSLVATVSSVDTSVLRFPTLFDNSSANNPDLVANFGADSSFAGNKTRQGNTDSNGIGDFYYTPPTGYLALCTDNLPEPTIVDSETQFNVVTWTGTGSTQAITGVGFQPDFVWIKSRNYTYNHWLFDSVRGTGNLLASNTTDAEASYPTILSSFDSDGFTTDSNGSNFNFVAWCWKAGGTAVTNTDGSITSSVSANVDAGFSVVGHTGNGVDEATIGHGLSQAPDMIITKNRDSAVDWRVYHSSLPTDYLLRLNLTSAQATNVTNGWIHNVTSTTFAANNYSGIAGVNSSGVDYIHYCFHSVDGFSKIGSYTGNGSANGPFIYTGFRPAFVMMKRTDSTSDWTLLDTSRSAYNVVSNRLWANLSTAESTAGLPLDIVSNGFKLRTSDAYANASGGTYIYMAFAESPTKFSLAR